MKKGLTFGKACLVCMGIGLLIIVLCVCITLYRPSDDFLTSIVTKHEDMLAEIAEAALNTGEKPDLSQIEGAKRTLAKYGIDSVFPDGDRVIFAYDFEYAPLEGHLYLVYQPNGEHELSVYSPEDWHAVETGDENTLRWEGGMGGRGWIDVARLSDRFFFEKAYLPT